MRQDLFDQLLESVREVQETQAGRRKPATVVRLDDLVPDIIALRRRFRLSQAKFAALLGISVDTLQNWEQGRRSPQGPAKVLLRVAAAHPEALLAVSGQRPRRRTAAPTR